MCDQVVSELTCTPPNQLKTPGELEPSVVSTAHRSNFRAYPVRLFFTTKPKEPQALGARAVTMQKKHVWAHIWQAITGQQAREGLRQQQGTQQTQGGEK